MGRKHKPLTCKEVKTILKNLGFTPRPRKGTSHEQWTKETDNTFHKVTVDCPKSPFTQTLISSMAKQAGVSKRTFYENL